MKRWPRGASQEAASGKSGDPAGMGFRLCKTKLRVNVELAHVTEEDRSTREQTTDAGACARAITQCVSVCEDEHARVKTRA